MIHTILDCESACTRENPSMRVHVQERIRVREYACKGESTCESAGIRVSEESVQL